MPWRIKSVQCIRISFLSFTKSTSCWRSFSNVSWFWLFDVLWSAYCDDVVGVLVGVPAVHDVRVGQRQRAARVREEEWQGGRHRRITSQVTWSPVRRHRVRWFPTASVQQWVIIVIISITIVRYRYRLRISLSLRPATTKRITFNVVTVFVDIYFIYISSSSRNVFIALNDVLYADVPLRNFTFIEYIQ